MCILVSRLVIVLQSLPWLILISSKNLKFLKFWIVSRAFTARVSSDHIKQLGQICTSKYRPLLTWLPAVVSLWHMSQFIISPQNGSDLLVFSLSKCSSPKICSSAISAARLYIFACLLFPCVSVTLALNSAIVLRNNHKTLLYLCLYFWKCRKTKSTTNATDQ